MGAFSERIQDWVRHGPANAAAKAIKKVLRPALEYGVLRVYGWELRTAAEFPAPVGLTAREIAPEEMEAAAGTFGRTAEDFLSRARGGDRCFCAFQAGRPVHMCWVSRRPTKLFEMELYMCPRDNEAYLYDSFVLPAFRGQRVVGVTRRVLGKTLFAEGIRFGCCYVLSDNYSSLRSLAPYHELRFELPYLRPRVGETRYLAPLQHPLYVEPVFFGDGREEENSGLAAG